MRRVPIFLSVLLFGGLAQAQAIPPEVRAELGPGKDPVILVTSFGKKGSARLHPGKGKAITLHEREAAGSLAVGHGRVVIALSVEDETHPFRVHVMSGADPGKAVKIARPTKRGDIPFAVAATATPDGFALFFQEVQTDDPSAAHTYLVLLDAEGKPKGAASEIPVPWSLGAAIWNGAGYHLALFYPGDQSGMRLSMVSITASGQPQQHPDWASKAGFITDVHLIAREGKISAFYRGGKSGDRLVESDVTAIGAWGAEPARVKDHGALPQGKVITLASDGKPLKIDRPSAR
jgi:hypothetical protein